MSENNADPEDTGQISVAELLARNGQKSTGVSAGGRRRRGVKGGISVAELTGEIPIVRAEPPKNEAPVIATDAVEAPTSTSTSPSPPPPPPRAKNEPEPELLSGSTTAAGDLLNKAHDETERRPYGAAATQRPTPALRQPVTQDQPPSPRPTPATRRSAVPDADSDGAQDGSGRQRVERSRRSTGFVSRSRAQPTEADAEPKTDVTPKPSTQAPSVPKASGDSNTSVAPDADAEVTTETPDLTKRVEAVAAQKTAAQKTAAQKVAEEKSASDTAEPEGETEAATKAAPVVEGEAPDAVRAPGKKDAAKQWLVLAGQGVVAVIVGALLFKGFERLWDMLPWVALILAVLVIVGLVAVVRILRRTDDIISMVIAIAVGVFVTLGPLAFQLSTG